MTQEEFDPAQSQAEAELDAKLAQEEEEDDYCDPSCRDCGGMYCPGTEECDWCPDEELCAGLISNESEA